jgi:hypothetical protein
VNRSWSWFRTVSIVAIIGLVLALGGMLLGQYYMVQPTTPLPPPLDEATRRAAQRERIAGDLKQIGNYYKAYCTDGMKPTSEGFWKYLEAQDGARAVCGSIKQQQ